MNSLPKIVDKYREVFAPREHSSASAVLGLGAFGHDASAAMLDRATGDVLFAIAEERLSNVKHDWNFPIASVDRCCQYAMRHNIMIDEIAVNFVAEEFLTKTMFKEIDRVVSNADVTRSGICQPN